MDDFFANPNAAIHGHRKSLIESISQRFTSTFRDARICSNQAFSASLVPFVICGLVQTKLSILSPAFHFQSKLYTSFLFQFVQLSPRFLTMAKGVAKAVRYDKSMFQESDFRFSIIHESDQRFSKSLIKDVACNFVLWREPFLNTHTARGCHALTACANKASQRLYADDIF